MLDEIIEGISGLFSRLDDDDEEKFLSFEDGIEAARNKKKEECSMCADAEAFRYEYAQLRSRLYDIKCAGEEMESVLICIDLDNKYKELGDHLPQGRNPIEIYVHTEHHSTQTYEEVMYANLTAVASDIQKLQTKVEACAFPASSPSFENIKLRIKSHLSCCNQGINEARYAANSNYSMNCKRCWLCAMRHSDPDLIPALDFKPLRNLTRCKTEMLKIYRENIVPKFNKERNITLPEWSEDGIYNHFMDHIKTL